MAHRENRRLFEVLDECVFQPVLRTQEGAVPQDKRFMLPPLKDALSQQREHFYTCASDEEVYQAYHEQMSSEETDKINHELRELNLPALTDCREQFEVAASNLFDKQVRKQTQPGLDRS
ncbi:hypothetical protein F6455_10180 [Proteobacteria bacterium 005FR1]|nr:hypothetical protein [Proteobacteria bacterium 005FR1]